MTDSVIMLAVPLYTILQYFLPHPFPATVGIWFRFDFLLFSFILTPLSVFHKHYLPPFHDCLVWLPVLSLHLLTFIQSEIAHLVSTTYPQINSPQQGFHQEACTSFVCVSGFMSH